MFEKVEQPLISAKFEPNILGLFPKLVRKAGKLFLNYTASFKMELMPWEF